MLNCSVLLLGYHKVLSRRQGARLVDRISTVKCHGPKSLLSRALVASPHYRQHDLCRPAVHRAEIHRARMNRAQTWLVIKTYTVIEENDAFTAPIQVVASV